MKNLLWSKFEYRFTINLFNFILLNSMDKKKLQQIETYAIYLKTSV